jgi:hypothetical protein
LRSLIFFFFFLDRLRRLIYPPFLDRVRRLTFPPFLDRLRRLIYPPFLDRVRRLFVFPFLRPFETSLFLLRLFIPIFLISGVPGVMDTLLFLDVCRWHYLFIFLVIR